MPTYNRINGSRVENLERAIGFCEAALTVFTREDFPEQWATAQYDLTIAYSERIKGSRADNLEEAIGFCEAALKSLPVRISLKIGQTLKIT